MKGLKISVVLIVCVFVVNAYFYVYLKHTTRDICAETGRAFSFAVSGDTENLIISMGKIENMIEKASPLWQVVINHSEADDVNMCFAKAKGCLDSRNGQIHLYLRELLYDVDNIYQRERLTIYNIF